MAKTYNRLELDVNKKPNSIGIRPVQNDTKSRYLDVCLYENGVPINLTGEQVRITFRKADGSTFFNQGEVTDAAAGRCQFALTNEILSEAKAVEAQISVWNAGGQILSTQVFEIYVTAAIPWTDSVESENEYGVLVVLFQEIQDALDTMHKIAAAFGEPGDKAAEYGVDTFWGILETLAQRGDVESSLQKGIKAYLNSTVGTSGFQSLDKLLGAVLVLRGTWGTEFVISNDEKCYPDFTVVLNENSEVYSGSEYVQYVPVPLGAYSIKISVDNYSTTKSVEVTQLGIRYLVTYSFTIATLTNSSTFQVPTNVDTIYISAAGGGGGGAAGGGYPSYTSGGGGGGGGGAAYIYKKKFKVTPLSYITCTVGQGGSGGAGVYDSAGNPGSQGTPTVVGTLVTLQGGYGGLAGKNSSSGGVGGAGAENGGAGGTGGNGTYKGSTVSADGNAGNNSEVASGGSGGKSVTLGGGGGGGGASLGNGGNGSNGNSSKSGSNGSNGGGGGGAGGYNVGKSDAPTLKGGEGGNGIIIFYRGVFE